MVKGISRRVVVIKSPDAKFFEQAIVILKDDVTPPGGKGSIDIVHEACRIASSCTQEHKKEGFFRRIPSPVFAMLGAAAVALIWIITMLV